MQYRALIQQDLEQVLLLMRSACQSIPEPLRASVLALIEGGGKRLRPALVLLSSGICQADRKRATLSAAAVEMLHTATLIHDDLIDSSGMRRGVETLNVRWTPPATVLTGDVVFALSAELIARSGSPRLVLKFAETLETICLGEIDQMLDKNGHLPSLEGYYRRIYAKTASLFALSFEAGPILGGCSEDEIERGRRFGKLVGEAFQITDDILDLNGKSQVLGKPVGADLRQGLITLPVLLYQQEHPSDPDLHAVLAKTADDAALQRLIAEVEATGATRQAMETAQANIEEALQLLREYPSSSYREALEELLAFAIERQY